MHSIIASGLNCRRKSSWTTSTDGILYSRRSNAGSIKKKNMICLNPDTPGTSMCAQSHKRQFTGSTLFALSEWDQSSTRQGRMRTLHDTLPPACIERVVSRKNREILYTRISKSPRPAHTIIRKAHRQTNLDQNAEESASSSQLARTGKPVTLKSRTMFDQQKKRKVKKKRR